MNAHACTCRKAIEIDIGATIDTAIDIGISV